MHTTNLYKPPPKLAEQIIQSKILKDWCPWVVQLVKHPSLDFGSGYDLQVVRSEPCTGLHARVNLAYDSLPPSSSAPLQPHSKNQIKKKLNKPY